MFLLLLPYHGVCGTAGKLATDGTWGGRAWRAAWLGSHTIPFLLCHLISLAGLPAHNSTWGSLSTGEMQASRRETHQTQSRVSVGLVRGENVLVLLAKAPLSLGAQALTPVLCLFVSGILLLLLPSVAFPFLLAPSHQHLDRLTSLTPQKPFYLVECPTFKSHK